MCCHHHITTVEKKHTVNYVVVKRPLSSSPNDHVLLGAMSIAEAHQSKISDVMKYAHKLSLGKPHSVNIKAKIEQVTKWLVTQPEYVRSVCNEQRGAAYLEALKAGSFGDFDHDHVSVLDVADAGKRFTAHDARVTRLLSIVAPPGPGAGEIPFDNGGSPVPFHHSLRGISFTIRDLEEQKGDGVLVLRYNDKADKADKAEKAEKADKARVVVSLNSVAEDVHEALSSHTVFVDVTKAYYVGAHRIQCTGHARFECFRVIGNGPKRYFVGEGTNEQKQAQFRSFVRLLTADSTYGVPPACTASDTPGTHVTPMMIAAAIRPMLLMSHKVSVNVNRTDYGTKLHVYLKKELVLDEWKPDIKLVDDLGDIAVEILDEGTKTKGNQPNVGTSQKGSDDKKAADAKKKIVATSQLFQPKLEEWKAKTLEKGTLVIFEDQTAYDSSSLRSLPTAVATIDIRDQKPFKSMIDDVRSIACNQAVFFCSNAPTHYPKARVVASKYFHSTDKGPAPKEKQPKARPAKT